MTVCVVCKAPADKKCSLCHSVYYCSKEHQKHDWKKHKAKCIFYKVEENEVLGRYLVASRVISPGEEILREKPLVSGPQECTPPVCLGCYRQLSNSTCIECPKCGWPMCSIECTKSPHHIPECKITSEVRGAKVKIQTFNVAHPSYSPLIVLRCLYMKKDRPSTWEKLSRLQSHCKERKESGRYEQERISIAQFILRFFKLTDFNEDDILRVAGIVNVNGHEVPISSNNFVSIYETASFLEHSCFANCSKGFSSNGELVIRAAKTIQTGEHLSICYTDPLYGAASRRQHLLQTKYFSCSCERCKDGTEMGTHFNSVRCIKPNCKGFLVPENPLSEIWTWKCNTCHNVAPSEAIDLKVEQGSLNLSLVDKSNLNACKKFIKEAENIFHPNNFLITSAKLAVTDILDEGTNTMSDEDLALKMLYCRQLLKLTKTLVPAENRCIGVLLFGLHAALAETGRRKSNTGEIDPDGLRNNLLECRDILTESYRLLRYEPEILPEGQIALQAKQNLKDIEKILQTLHVQLGNSIL